MIIISPKIEYHYELERLSALFFPMERHITQETAGEEDNYFSADANTTDDGVKIDVVLCRNSNKLETHIIAPLSELEYVEEEMLLARYVYLLLSKLTGTTQQWGVLTGVRPVKLLGYAIDSGMDYEKLKVAFVEKRCLSPEKYELALKTHLHERAILNRSTPDSYSLYVGIPFCPSRCSYCSFVSHSIERAGKLLEPYLENLCKEIIKTAEVTNELNLKLRTIYIGGGTPTILSDKQLEKLMKTINDSFDVKSAWEYTVEAGRADTITKEKLEVIKKYNATRISINPQTFNDDVLVAIGRKHTANDTIEKFKIARELGFDNINMDIIAGLPTDTLDSFKATVDKLIELSPENITVHTLSVKRSADLNDENAKERLREAHMTEDMVSYAQKNILDENYVPYYLYRQKNMIGNLENTGFCKEGYEGLYNVYIMDETHTILACGAGSVTKLRLPKSQKLERIFNYKFPYEYIDNFDEILVRKEKVKEFYEADNI
ncbi:MAG: coproporphyrinogen dehydrogenase HemZ [Oscillospiraceae bacterium]